MDEATWMDEAIAHVLLDALDGRGNDEALAGVDAWMDEASEADEFVAAPLPYDPMWDN